MSCSVIHGLRGLFCSGGPDDYRPYHKLASTTTLPKPQPRRIRPVAEKPRRRSRAPVPRTFTCHRLPPSSTSSSSTSSSSSSTSSEQNGPPPSSSVVEVTPANQTRCSSSSSSSRAQHHHQHQHQQQQQQQYHHHHQQQQQQQHRLLPLFTPSPFHDAVQFNDWLCSGVVVGAWREFELATDFLARPHHHHASAPDKARVCRLARDAISCRSPKYLVYCPDKSQWAADDHHVRFLVRVVRDSILKGVWREPEWTRRGMQVAETVYELLAHLRSSGAAVVAVGEGDGQDPEPPGYETLAP